MENVYCLFEGRHELPSNKGAICSSFDFTTFKVERSSLWEEAVASDDVTIIVTGLTPALTEFIRAWVNNHVTHDYSAHVGGCWYGWGVIQGRLSLMHYNNESKDYVVQRMF